MSGQTFHAEPGGRWRWHRRPWRGGSLASEPVGMRGDAAGGLARREVSPGTPPGAVLSSPDLQQHTHGYHGNAINHGFVVNFDFAVSFHVVELCF